MTMLTMFSFGYWGWGNTTQQLVEAVNVVEATRGFQPPLWVDIRLRRNVRAIGFSGHAFADVVGEDKYCWMPELGNANLGNPSATRARIKDPSKSTALLDLALQEARTNKRRVIFFCSCPFPVNIEKSYSCHRKSVARLLLKRASGRGVPLSIEEWPGGNPKTITLSRDASEVNRLRHGRKRIPLESPEINAHYAGLPWGTIARIASGAGEVLAVVDSARYHNGAWYLPVRQFDDADAGLCTLKAEISKWRERSGLTRFSA